LVTEPGHAQHQRVLVGQRALGHQRVGHRDVEVLGQLPQRCSPRGAAQTAAQIDQRPFGGSQRRRDRLGVGRRDDRPGRPLRQWIGRHSLGHRAGEDVHRHVEQNRARPAAGGGPERALGEAGEVLDPVHLPRPLDERAIDGRLVVVVVEVDLLMRVPAVHVGRNVTGDRDQRHRVERGRGHPGDRVHHARAHVHQQHARLSGGPGIAVGGVGRGLLVARDDEVDVAAPDRVQQSDVGVPAGAEDPVDPVRPQLLDQRIGSGWRAHQFSPQIDIPRSISVFTTV
jgi:hypothetical protein